MLVVLLIQTPFRDEALPFSIDSAVEDASHRDFLGQVAGVCAWFRLLRKRPSILLAGRNKASRIRGFLHRLPGVKRSMWTMPQHSLAAEIAGWSSVAWFRWPSPRPWRTRSMRRLAVQFSVQPAVDRDQALLGLWPVRPSAAQCDPGETSAWLQPS